MPRSTAGSIVGERQALVPKLSLRGREVCSFRKFQAHKAERSDSRYNSHSCLKDKSISKEPSTENANGDPLKNPGELSTNGSRGG